MNIIAVAPFTAMPPAATQIHAGRASRRSHGIGHAIVQIELGDCEQLHQH
jgi:hypothetical protein